MKLKPVRRFRSGSSVRARELFEITHEMIDFCCAEMKEAWSERFIAFGEFDSMANKNSDVNIYRCHPYPDGPEWDKRAIRFCPFCAEPIEKSQPLRKT